MNIFKSYLLKTQTATLVIATKDVSTITGRCHLRDIYAQKRGTQHVTVTE